jgi:hypothetical protein
MICIFGYTKQLPGKRGVGKFFRLVIDETAPYVYPFGKYPNLK